MFFGFDNGQQHRNDFAGHGAMAIAAVRDGVALEAAEPVDEYPDQQVCSALGSDSTQ